MSAGRDSKVLVPGAADFNYDGVAVLHGRSVEFLYQMDEADFQTTLDLVLESASGHRLEQSALTIISAPK